MVATAPVVAGAALQVVSGAGTGGTHRVHAVMLQTVSTSTAGRAKASFFTAQLVTKSTSAFIKPSYVTAQVVRQGDNGNTYIAKAASAQAVYTIGIQDVPRRLAWTYTLDGHYFYCLDLGEDGTHVYDLTTQQWTEFDTVGYSGHFNFKNGIWWKTGQRIVGGDILSGAIYEMVPDLYLDDGWRPVFYEARGALFAQGVDKRKNYALRLVGSVGRLTDDIAPELHMQFSDDQGATWGNEYTITLTVDTKQRLEWRSLGAFAAPGRIFRLYDTGGLKWLGWVEADIE